MKLCPDDKQCPYQSYFDTLWKLEAIDPGLCESFLSEPNSKCLLKQKPEEPIKKGLNMGKLKITRAVRYLGTGRVMVWPNEVQLAPLQGRWYSEVKDTILEMSNSETKFYHRTPSEDPIQPVKEIEVRKEEW